MTQASADGSAPSHRAGMTTNEAMVSAGVARAATDLYEALLQASDGTVRLDDQTLREVVKLLAFGTDAGEMFADFRALMERDAVRAGEELVRLRREMDVALTTVQARLALVAELADRWEKSEAPLVGLSTDAGAYADGQYTAAASCAEQLRDVLAQELTIEAPAHLVAALHDAMTDPVPGRPYKPRSDR